MNTLFEREKINYWPLKERTNKVKIIEETIYEDKYKTNLNKETKAQIKLIASQLKKAKENNSSRMCVFGAHTIKNGLSHLLGKFVKDGWFTHLATNGAGIIHDWEFSYLGESSEDVRKNVQVGRFGTWEETGKYINLAIVVGAFLNLGYGESVGKMINEDGLLIPSIDELETIISNKNEVLEKRASAADLIYEIKKLNLKPGFLSIKHPYKQYSIQATCYKENIPFTDHPMFGHDIIYTHKANLGAAIGRTAEKDFLSFVNSVSNLENGVYLSVGSAIMSPMVFEKSISMCRNVCQQNNQDIKNCNIHVIDLQEKTWDWSLGEPPCDNPAYYLRFMKSFNRMGCNSSYTSSDNRDFLVELYKELSK